MDAGSRHICEAWVRNPIHAKMARRISLTNVSLSVKMAMLAGVPFATKIVWNQNTETNHLRQQLRALNLTAKGERVQRSLYQAMRRLASNISARASQIS